MNNQPFDIYKDKGVEYDYILSASVKVDIITDSNVMSTLLNLLNNEDFLAMYFEDVALGRVYAKVEYNENSAILQFTFGISSLDAKSQLSIDTLKHNIVDFILSLNKNIETTPELKIKESDINVDILKENYNVDELDKTLVSESKLIFSNKNNLQEMLLTSDGIVEKYINGNLADTMPFSKLGVIRECKSLLANGFTLTRKTEATIPNNPNNDDEENPLENPEQTKQELQQNIKDVEEIQDLKDELDNKLDTLNEDTNSEEYIVVVYTDVNNDGNYVPDVALKNSTGIIADNVDEAERYNKETAEKIAEQFSTTIDNENPKFIAKAIKLQDVDQLNGLYETRVYENEYKVLHETDETIEQDSLKFPTTDFTSKVLTIDEINKIDLQQDLSEKQINWVETNLGNIQEIVAGMKVFAEALEQLVDEPIISLDEYFNNMNTMEGDME